MFLVFFQGTISFANPYFQKQCLLPVQKPETVCPESVEELKKRRIKDELLSTRNRNNHQKSTFYFTLFLLFILLYFYYLFTFLLVSVSVHYWTNIFKFFLHPVLVQDVG